MTRIAILPEPLGDGGFTFRAVSGDRQSLGKTAGEALDGITAQLPESENGVLVVVQSQRPDQFFTANQRDRLGFLMGRWRAARDQGSMLDPSEQTELDALVQSELLACAARTAAFLRELQP